MPSIRFGAAAAVLFSLLMACQSEPASRSSGDDAIQVNQVGFAPRATKEALVPEGYGDDFAVVEAESGETVHEGRLSDTGHWPHSGETLRRADFTAVQTPGRYRVRVEGLPPSAAFDVQADAYRALNDAALKAYYFNRASTALEEAHAGEYAREPGHPDDRVLIHASAASDGRPEGAELSAPRGWYDAGDYNKYIVNSGISTYTLLAAYEQFPDYYRGRDLNIPESGDAVPDLLDEAMWNLTWMLTMQDPDDGGVYHKLTTKNFSGKVMPHEATEERYVVQKGTAAALNFAAVMATASRVYEPYEQDFPGFAELARDAAEEAWRWAEAHPDREYRNPNDIHTGEYGDDRFDDEFFWAATELYLATGEEAYREAMALDQAEIEVPSWADAVGQPWMSLAHNRERLSPEVRERVESRLIELADQLRTQWRDSAAGVPMREKDFVWGSNGVAMNSAMMLISGYQLSGDEGHRSAAQSLLDYVLGRNPTDYAYVTGFGERSPRHIHHRPSEADGIEAPIPGFLAGGPHSGQQDADACPAYPSDRPARSYLDHWCSYSTNEITINWNAPLVYVSGALDSLYAKDE